MTSTSPVYTSAVVFSSHWISSSPSGSKYRSGLSSAYAYRFHDESLPHHDSGVKSPVLLRLLPATELESPDASFPLSRPSRCDHRTASAFAGAAVRSAATTAQAVAIAAALEVLTGRVYPSGRAGESRFAGPCGGERVSGSGRAANGRRAFPPLAAVPYFCDLEAGCMVGGSSSGSGPGHGALPGWQTGHKIRAQRPGAAPYSARVRVRCSDSLCTAWRFRSALGHW